MQKTGLHSVTQHLAMELTDSKISVNTVSPAVVATPVYDGVFGGQKEATEALEGFPAFYPIGRNGPLLILRIVSYSYCRIRPPGLLVGYRIRMVVYWPEGIRTLF